MASDDMPSSTPYSSRAYIYGIYHVLHQAEPLAKNLPRPAISRQTNRAYTCNTHYVYAALMARQWAIIVAIRLAGRIDEYVANYSLVGRWAWEYRLQLIGFPDEADLHIQCVVLN